MNVSCYRSDLWHNHDGKVYDQTDAMGCLEGECVLYLSRMQHIGQCN